MEKLQNKIPFIRFPEFKDEWEEKKLGDIATFSKGKGISKKDISENGINSCIRYGELYTKYSEVIDSAFSKTNIDTSNLVFSKANDVIIPSSGETHIDIATASCVMNDGIILGGDLNIIKTKNDGVFLSYYLNSKKKIEIANLSQGSSVIHLYSSSLSLLKLSIPTIPEQTRIANFFSVLDNKINELKEKKAFLEKYKKGVIQKLSSDKQLKEVEFGGIAELRKKKFNPVNANVSFKCIELEHLDQGTGHLLGYIQSDKQKSQKNRFYKGDILFGKLRPYLNKFWKSDFEGVCSGEIWVLKPKNNIVMNDYLYFIIQTSQFFKTVTISSGSKMPRADWGLVSNGIISITIDKEEQTKIANFLSKIDDKINTVNEQIEESQEYKKGLLQKMYA